MVDPLCHVCTNHDPATLFCGPHALEHVRATPLSPDGGLVEVETTRGHLAIRTDPGETAESVQRRAEQAIAHLG